MNWNHHHYVLWVDYYILRIECDWSLNAKYSAGIFSITFHINATHIYWYLTKISIYPVLFPNAKSYQYWCTLYITSVCENVHKMSAILSRPRRFNSWPNEWLSGLISKTGQSHRNKAKCDLYLAKEVLKYQTLLDIGHIIKYPQNAGRPCWCCGMLFPYLFVSDNAFNHYCLVRNFFIQKSYYHIWTQTVWHEAVQKLI